MRSLLHWVTTRRFLGIAVPLTLFLTLSFPAVVSAHAIFLHADLAKDSVFSIALKLSPGQIDGPTLFNLIMITLVDLGAIFWMGAQLWINFVLTISEELTQKRET